jgi:hypothetical protein
VAQRIIDSNRRESSNGRQRNRTKMNNDEAPKKMFMNHILYEIELAAKRARGIKKRFHKGETRQDAEFIEQTLMRVAEAVAEGKFRA